jgi:hypothetical protein
MPASAFFGDSDSMADSGTPEDLLRKKFPGMFADTSAPAQQPFFNMGAPTAPNNVPPDMPAPDVGQGQQSQTYNLPWMRQYNQQSQPQQPSTAQRFVGGMQEGAEASQGIPQARPQTKAELLGRVLTQGLSGAMRGRAANEQMIAQSGGRRSGGVGVGFEAAEQAPLEMQQQRQQVQAGQIANQQQLMNLQNAPQLNQLNIATKIAEINKNISDAQKNRYVTPRSGGVYDVQTGQFAPGTEPQDKAATIDNLLATAADKAQREGRDPRQDPAVQQLSDVKTSLQRDVQPKTQNDFEQFYGKYLRDNRLPDTAQNMQRAHQAFEVKPVQPGAGDARLDRSYQYNSTALDKQATPIDATVVRLSRLQDTLNQNTPQADALVAPELLSVMSGGQGSGLRMNEAEISRVVGGRSNWESLKASINKWSTDPKTANSITTAQRQQIRALVATVGQKLSAKKAVLDGAQQDLINANDVSQHRQVVAGARTKLSAIDEGSQIQVTDPQGGVHTFPDQASANRFKQLAGIK